MARRILTEFVMDKIAAVDRPCQEHATVTIMKRDFSDKQRKKDAKSGAAMPGGGFPIEDTNDLHNAVRAIGRAKNPAAAKAHIRQRAKALGVDDPFAKSFASDETAMNAFRKLAMLRVDVLKANVKGLDKAWTDAAREASFAVRSANSYRAGGMGHDQAVAQAAKDHGVSEAKVHTAMRQHLDSTHGMSRAGYASYRRENS